MMIHRLELIRKNQRGFTLIELVIAIALSGLITGGITTTIFQVLDGNARTSNHMTVVRQVQNAGYWVSHDAQMAQGIVPTGNTGFPFTLIWTEWDGTKNVVIYDVELTGGPKLKRQHLTYAADGSPIGDETTIVAQYIVPGVPQTKVELTGGGTFRLPDTSDAFTITRGVGGDSGTIIVTAGSISVNAIGGATYDAGNWTTPTAGSKVVVTANEANTGGIWTATTGTATATITTDSDEDAILTGVLILTVTASAGTGSQEASETRVYKVIPRPIL